MKSTVSVEKSWKGWYNVYIRTFHDDVAALIEGGRYGGVQEKG